MSATAATGALLKIGDGATTENFTTVPGCSKITAPKVKLDLVDVTSHDSPNGFREFVAGLSDVDNVTAEIHWDPTNVVHTGLLTDAAARTKRNFQITFPTVAPGNKVAFTGYIIDIGPTANVGEALMMSVTIRVVGKPTWT